MDIIKYPRTCHVAGSRLQRGDEDLEIVPVESLRGRHMVIEEKQDGANSGISFDASGKLYLQSRGTSSRRSSRTPVYPFQIIVDDDAERLCLALAKRYVAYGEWMFSKHTVFYDALPHYWMEFDALDKDRSSLDRLFFLDTPARSRLLESLPIVPVKVLWSGILTRDIHLPEFIGPSHFVTMTTPRPSVRPARVPDRTTTALGTRRTRVGSWKDCTSRSRKADR